MTTAIERYFKQIISRGELNTVYITDQEGKLVVECLSDEVETSLQRRNEEAAANGEGEEGMEAEPELSNAIISGAAAMKHLAELRAAYTGVGGGTGASGAAGGGAGGGMSMANASGGVIAAQYNDNLCVTFMDGAAIVTLLGKKSKNQCIGGIMALVPVIRSHPVFREASLAIKRSIAD